MTNIMDTTGGSESILVVDDEKTILYIYARFLESLGYFVTTRASSVEALETFKKNPEAYDLVITDMTMPDMKGDRLAEAISECRSGIPIILNTGWSNLVVGENPDEMGVDALLLKPVNLSELALTIRRLIDSGPNRNT